MAREPYIDYSELKQRVPIQMLVQDHYNISLQEIGGQFVGNCILCGYGEEDSDRFKVTPDLGDTGGWKCHNPECVSNDKDNKHKNNVIELVAQVEGISVPKAAQAIAKWFNITDCNYRKNGAKPKTNGAAREEPTTPQTRDQASQSPISSAEKKAATEADYMGDDDKEDDDQADSDLLHNPPLEWQGLKGLDSSCEDLSNTYIWLPEIAAEFESGLCSRGMMKGRFAVPIHNIDGELLAYCGVALEETEGEPRLKFPPADKYDPSLDLFNLHRAIQDSLFKEHGQLVIVEDITEAFQVWDKDNKNVVATMQGVPTDQQILRLRNLDMPRKSFSIMWRKQSPELDQVLAKLAEFAWVRIRYAQ